jgi:hypothetical protein
VRNIVVAGARPNAIQLAVFRVDTKDGVGNKFSPKFELIIVK